MIQCLLHGSYSAICPFPDMLCLQQLAVLCLGVWTDIYISVSMSFISKVVRSEGLG